MAVLCVVVGLSSVAAQEEAQSESTFSITPRIWFGNLDQVEGEGERIEAFVIPLAGLTLTFSPRSLPNTNFLLTILAGEGDGDFVYYQIPGGTAEAERLDIEFLVRRNFPNRTFSFFYGARFIEFDDTNTIMCSSCFFAPFYKAEATSNVLVAEVGVGGVSDITEDSRHRLFGYVTLGYAYSDWEWEAIEGGTPFTEDGTGTDLAWDLNFGYQWHISPKISFSGRLRGFFIPEKNDEGLEKLTSILGPDFALTIRF
jgi:hypothetical protein